ncbi:MAG TPA: FAD-dependent oxidoreductase [Steroidobacteraceae bacterium]|nr:FAD-dependent oxidoreductase [Steroidobacteraceae bacterium]
MSASIPGGGVVIVGAGQAGADVTGYLRSAGYAGPITLIGDETYAPYRRPPLSKTFLAGEATLESLTIKSAAAYAKHTVDCRFGIGVEAIDRDARVLRLFDGTTVPYEHLVLATGGRARRLSLPGAEHPNVHYVRTIDDILKLKQQFVPGGKLVIIGGGYIGLEAAAVGRKKELQVTLVEALPRVLARVTTPELSAFYERVHRGHGVDIRTGIGVHAFEGDPRVNTVVLADGTRLPADLIIVGIGLIPNTELAEAAGLPVSNGIVVDQFTRTADPSIHAIGDCSNHLNEFYPGKRLRLESVPNATEQARVCAAAICGKPTPYNALPWFWSDQYDLKLQMVGLSEGYDQYVVRGDMSTASFSVFYLREGALISVDTVSRAQDFMLAKRLIAERVKPSPAVLVDESVPLKSLLEAKSA